MRQDVTVSVLFKYIYGEWGVILQFLLSQHSVLRSNVTCYGVFHATESLQTGAEIETCD